MKRLYGMTDFVVGEIYDTIRSGQYRIIKKLPGYGKYRVEFTATGYRGDANARNMAVGRLHDYKVPTHKGVGYLGAPNLKGEADMLYEKWRKIIHRHADTSNKCTVCEEWYSLKAFMAWADTQVYEKRYTLVDLTSFHPYHLEDRQYRPDNCLFINRSFLQRLHSMYTVIVKDGVYWVRSTHPVNVKRGPFDKKGDAVHAREGLLRSKYEKMCNDVMDLPVKMQEPLYDLLIRLCSEI